MGVYDKIELKKEALVEEFRTTLDVAAACKKVGVSTPVFYYWMRSDGEFFQAASLALRLVREERNSKAEEVLMKQVEEGSFQAAKYWLEHNDSRYKKSGMVAPALDVNRMVSAFGAEAMEDPGYDINIKNQAERDLIEDMTIEEQREFFASEYPSLYKQPKKTRSSKAG